MRDADTPDSVSLQLNAKRLNHKPYLQDSGNLSVAGH